MTQDILEKAKDLEKKILDLERCEKTMLNDNKTEGIYRYVYYILAGNNIDISNDILNIIKQYKEKFIKELEEL